MIGAVALLCLLATTLAAADLFDEVSVSQCNVWAHQALCPPGAVAVEGQCWRLGSASGEACDSVCGGLDALDVEGTRMGSSSTAVVTCIEAGLLGGEHIVHDFLYLQPAC